MHVRASNERFAHRCVSVPQDTRHWRFHWEQIGRVESERWLGEFQLMEHRDPRIRPPMRALMKTERLRHAMQLDARVWRGSVEGRQLNGKA